MVRIKVITPEERCPTCDRVTKHSVEHYFCDYCNKEMSRTLGERELRSTLFREGYSNTTNFYFCSWKCHWDWILENREMFREEDFNFINLPYIKTENQEEFFESLQVLCQE